MSGENPADPNDKTPRSPSRTFTPRRYDRSNCELDVEFMHHGAGLESNRANIAKAGDLVFIGGPGGGYDILVDLKKIVTASDTN